VLGAPTDGPVKTESIRQFLTESLDHPCTTEQADAVCNLINKTEEGDVELTELHSAITTGCIRRALTEVQKTSGKIKDKAPEVSRDLMKTWIAWRYNRDDAFQTLPIALLYMLVFVGLMISHLRIKERMQQEQAIETWVLGWSEDWGGPYLTEHVTNVNYWWYWASRSGVPCLFSDERINAADKPWIHMASTGILIGDAKLVVTPEEGDDREEWLINSPEGQAELKRLQNAGEELAYMKAARFKVEQLAASGWAGDQPAFIRMIWATYNEQAKMYVMNEVKVEFDPSGFIIPSMASTAVFMQPYPSYWVLGFVVIYGLLIFKDIFAEGGDMCGALSHGLTAFRSYWGFWNCVDWSTISMGFINSALWSLCCWFMGAESLQNLIDEDFELDTDIMSLKAPELQLIFDDLGFIVMLFFVLQCIVALNVTTILANLFKAFQSNARLSVVTDTIKVALEDIIHFMIVFMVIFISFALIAHILFGNDLQAFQSFGLSMTTSFDVLMGAFDWFVDFMENPADLGSGMPRFLVTAWFLCYNTSVLLVLLNMLMAIILDRYAQMAAKLEGSAEAPTLWVQVRRFFQRRAETKGFIPLLTLVTKLEVDDDIHSEQVVTKASLMDAFNGMSEKQAAWLMKNLEKEAKARAPAQDLSNVTDQIYTIDEHVETIAEQMHSVHENVQSLQDRVTTLSSGPSPENSTSGRMEQALDRFSEYSYELQKQQNATRDMQETLKRLMAQTASLVASEPKSRG